MNRRVLMPGVVMHTAPLALYPWHSRIEGRSGRELVFNVSSGFLRILNRD